MRVEVTTHAAERYIERVKPLLTVEEARTEIKRLAALSKAVPFLSYHEEGEHFDAYVELAPGIAVGCHANSSDELLAVTTMIRTGENKTDRARRRKAKKERKQQARKQKRREQIARKLGESKRPTYGIGWPE